MSALKCLALTILCAGMLTGSATAAPQDPCAGQRTIVMDFTVGDRYHFAESGINGPGFALNCVIRVDPFWANRASILERRIVVWHEMGHQMGFGHVPGTIMDAHPVDWFYGVLTKAKRKARGA